jgi:hypothetical protein
MWTPVLLFYGAGLAVTAVTLLRTQMFKHDRLMNAGSIALWPIYWTLYLITLFQNRSRH